MNNNIKTNKKDYLIVIAIYITTLASSFIIITN